MVRTFPAALHGQTQHADRAARRRRCAATPCCGGYYEWEGMRYVPSWGGSMFEALMPTLVLDEPRLAPREPRRQRRAHVAVQRASRPRRSAIRSGACRRASIPGRTGYGEYGVDVLGAHRLRPRRRDAARGGAGARRRSPAAAIANLRQLAERYTLYGDWGFYDAVDPVSGAVAHTYLALDQAMIFVALANHLTGHRIQRLFAADPIVRRALPVIAGERFFE